MLNFVYEIISRQLRILYFPIFYFQVSMPTLHSLFYGKKMGPRIPDTRSGDTMNNTVSTVCSEKKITVKTPCSQHTPRNQGRQQNLCTANASANQYCTLTRTCPCAQPKPVRKSPVCTSIQRANDCKQQSQCAPQRAIECNNQT